MSLFGAINNSVGSLQTAQVGLQTVGNNIANANTEGYIRQELIQTTPAPNRLGNLIIGHGVRAAAIMQRVDEALMERMWNAGSDLAGARLRERTLSDVEALMNDLNGGGLSDDLQSLNAAIHDLSAEPHDMSLRQFVIMTGDTLAREINRTYVNAKAYQDELDKSLDDRINRVNALANKVAELNLEIMKIEGGGTLGSQATGLRDERYRAIEEIGELIKVNTQEQASGAISLFVGGDYLVAETHTRELYVRMTGEENKGEIVFQDTNAAVEVEGGELKSMTEGRDVLLSGVLDGLDRMAMDLIRQFNRVHSQGQGARGFDSLTGTVQLDPTTSLNESGLQWEVEGGAFDISIVGEDGTHLARHQIQVQQGPLPQGSSVQSIVNQIDAIDGLRAEVNSAGRLVITSTTPGNRFVFGEDTSGFVAAAGLNTFFEGNRAETIAVNPILLANPEFFAVSAGGIGMDADVLNSMVDLVDQGIDYRSGKSISEGYIQIVNGLAQSASTQKAVTAGLEQYYTTMQSEHLAISGVSIDEEAIKMISYQRVFQASSRVISVANEMLEMLVSL